MVSCDDVSITLVCKKTVTLQEVDEIKCDMRGSRVRLYDL